jgi:hypothetical protein
MDTLVVELRVLDVDFFQDLIDCGCLSRYLFAFESAKQSYNTLGNLQN